MDLIANLNYPYIVEFKDAWVEKVRTSIFVFLFFFNKKLFLLLYRDES